MLTFKDSFVDAMLYTFLYIVGLVIGLSVGDSGGRNNLIQELCKSQQYDFCEVAEITYKIRKEEK